MATAVHKQFLIERRKRPRDLRSTMSRFSEASRILFSLAAACYVLGIFVLNANLSAYGLTSFEIFRAKYALAGFWYLFVTGTFLYLVWVVAQDYRDSRERRLGKLESSSLAAGYTGFLFFLFWQTLKWALATPEPILRLPGSTERIFVSIVFLFLLTPGIMAAIKKLQKCRWLLFLSSALYGLGWIMIALLSVHPRMLLPFGFLLLVPFVFDPKKFLDVKENLTHFSNPENARRLLYAIAFLFFSVFYFGRYVYPSIRPELGGGFQHQSK